MTTGGRVYRRKNPIRTRNKNETRFCRIIALTVRIGLTLSSIFVFGLERDQVKRRLSRRVALICSTARRLSRCLGTLAKRTHRKQEQAGEQ